MVQGLIQNVAAFEVYYKTGQGFLRNGIALEVYFITGHLLQNRSLHPVPGPGLRTGGLKVFLAIKKEGQKLFLTRETWGFVLFFIKKRGGHYLNFLIKKGGSNFFLQSLFANNVEPWQSMPLSKGENKLLEITRDPCSRY